MEEEKGKETQGGKRRRGLIKGKGIWVIGQKERETLIKEEIGRRRRSLERGEEVFRGSRSSGLLGPVFCLMMMMWFFI